MRDLIRRIATYRFGPAFVPPLAFAVLACIGSIVLAPAAVGQADDSVLTAATGDDSLSRGADLLADSLRRHGYYYARVDTIRNADGSSEAVIWHGPRVTISRVDVTGVEPVLRRRLESVVESDEADFFDRAALEADIGRLLAVMEREGHPLAQAEIEQIRPVPGRGNRLTVTVAIDPGPIVPLKRIDLPGAVRTSSRLVSRLADLQVGEPLTQLDPEAIRSQLEDTGLFDAVGLPELYIDADTTAVLRIPIEEGDPGTFDLVLGYLPAGGGNDAGKVVGNGHLALRNLFGGGRSMSVRLHRLPNQVSRIDVSASDPFVAGMPVGIGVGFHGIEQDSTFGKQSYRGEISYHLSDDMDVIGGFSREVTGPGQAGVRLGPDGRQVIPDADAWFIGLGVRFSTVDRPVNPIRGLWLEMNLESGSKERTERRVLGTDTTRTTRSIEQRRLQAALRYFVPTFLRQTIVLGGDAGLLLSNEYDRSDLFRFGGATSLRGYDEDQFLGRTVGRALAEYRFLIDTQSYAYAFFDLGYVDRPSTPDLTPQTALYPGYGIGIQFRTAVGLINVSAALNPDSGPTETRIHAGLTFGL